MAYSRCGDENHHSLFAIPWVRREVIAAAAAVAAARQQLDTLDAVFVLVITLGNAGAAGRSEELYCPSFDRTGLQIPGSAGRSGELYCPSFD